MKKCPVCGEADCPWWESRYEEHELEEEFAQLEEEEEEPELERERRTRG